MSRFLLINGPNLNFLGRRDPALYGATTLAEIEKEVAGRAASLGHEMVCFQSNSEGAIVDFIQENWQRNRRHNHQSRCTDSLRLFPPRCVGRCRRAGYRGACEQHPCPRRLPQPLGGRSHCPRPDCRVGLARIFVGRRPSVCHRSRGVAHNPP